MDSDKKLNDYYYYYNSLVEVLIVSSTDNIELCLKKIEFVTWFAWYFHPAYFVDSRIENKLFEISSRLFNKDFVAKQRSIKAKRSILHIATAVYPTGGHTRLISNIALRDKESSHSLALTRQDGQLIPEWLTQAIINSSGDICDVQKQVNQSSVIASVKFLRNLAAKYDYIFLHVHPNDTTVFVALAYGFEIPIAFINHADHVFNIGTSLVDTVVCTREWSEKLALERRLAERVDILPLPLNFKPYDISEKHAARERLGLRNNDILILSVASYYKFIPNGKYDFMSLAKDIVSRYEKVKFKVIGVAKEDAAQVGYIADDRIELLGLVENPRDFYLAADIYLDSMPFSSFTALWEAIYFKAFPILQFAPSAKQRHDDELAIQGIVKHAKTKEGLMCELERILSIDNTVIIDKLFDNINYYYAGSGWNLFLDNLYKSLDKFKRNSFLFEKVNYPEFLDDDIDAANMPTPFNSVSSKNYFVDLLHQNLSIISIKELICLRKCVFKSTGFKVFATLKSLLGLMKLKKM